MFHVIWKKNFHNSLQDAPLLFRIFLVFFLVSSIIWISLTVFKQFQCYRWDSQWKKRKLIRQRLRLVRYQRRWSSIDVSDNIGVIEFSRTYAYTMYLIVYKRVYTYCKRQHIFTYGFFYRIHTYCIVCMYIL